MNTFTKPKPTKASNFQPKPTKASNFQQRGLRGSKLYRYVFVMMNNWAATWDNASFDLFAKRRLKSACASTWRNLHHENIYIFLFLLKNIDCGYSLKPPLRGGSNKYHNLCFEQKYDKYQNFSSESFHFFVVKFTIYLNRRFFVMIFLAIQNAPTENSEQSAHAHLNRRLVHMSAGTFSVTILKSKTYSSGLW